MAVIDFMFDERASLSLSLNECWKMGKQEMTWHGICVKCIVGAAKITTGHPSVVIHQLFLPLSKLSIHRKHDEIQ